MDPTQEELRAKLCHVPSRKRSLRAIPSLDEYEAKRLLAAYGVSVPRGGLVSSKSEAVVSRRRWEALSLLRPSVAKSSTRPKRSSCSSAFAVAKKWRPHIAA